MIHTLKFFHRFIVSLVQHAYQMTIAVMLCMLIVYLWPIRNVGADIIWSFGSDWNSNQIFHFFHFFHIALAAATAVLTIYRLTQKMWFALLFGSVFPVIFCTASDILLPYLGALLLGVHLQLHLCLVCNTSAMLTFVILGVLLGFLLAKFVTSKFLLFLARTTTHFFHGLTGAIAALIYMTGFGFQAWPQSVIYVFILMLFAVTLPCVISDFILPNFVVDFLGISHPGHCCESKIL